MRSRSALVSRRRGGNAGDILSDAAGERGEPQRHCGGGSGRPSNGNGGGELREVGDTAEDDRQDARLLHQRDDLDGARRDDDAAHLLPDALGGEIAQVVPRADAAPRARRRRSAPSPYARVKAEEAEDAQAILGDAAIGVADETDAAGHEIGIAADGIVDGARRHRPTARSW